MKKIYSIIAIVSIVILIIAGVYFAGWLTRGEDLSGLPQLITAKGPAYEYSPLPYLDKDWKLIDEKVKLNQFNVDIQENLLGQDILDVCVWEFEQEES